MGDFPIQPDTTWYTDFNARKYASKWGGKPVRFKPEEYAFGDGQKVIFLDDPQTEPYLIPRQ